MRNVFVAAVVAAILVPVAGFAAEATGKVKSFDAATKVVTLENNTACTLGANVAATGIAAGKEVTLTYTSANNVNTCSAVAVK
jgi:Cu/Ag efflux protein CusF